MILGAPCPEEGKFRLRICYPPSNPSCLPGVPVGRLDLGYNIPTIPQITVKYARFIVCSFYRKVFHNLSEIIRFWWYCREDITANRCLSLVRVTTPPRRTLMQIVSGCILTILGLSFRETMGQSKELDCQCTALPRAFW